MKAEVLPLPKNQSKRQVKRAFLLMEILISLGLFATVVSCASVPYYRLKQTLQKEWLYLEGYRLSQLLQVLEMQPAAVRTLWPYWESLDLTHPIKIHESWVPFEEEAMTPWQIESTLFLEDQTPRKASVKYPAWRRYMTVKRQLYYQKKHLESSAQEFGYSYSLISKKNTSQETDGGNL